MYYRAMVDQFNNFVGFIKAKNVNELQEKIKNSKHKPYGNTIVHNPYPHYLLKSEVKKICTGSS